MTEYKLETGTIGYGQEPTLEEQIRIAKIRIANEMILIESLEKRNLENKVRLEIEKIRPVVKDDIPHSLDDKEGWDKYTKKHGRSWELCLEHMKIYCKENGNCHGIVVYERPTKSPCGDSQPDYSGDVKFTSFEEGNKYHNEMVVERNAMYEKNKPDDLERLKEYGQRLRFNEPLTEYQKAFNDAVQMFQSKIQSIQEGK